MSHRGATSARVPPVRNPAINPIRSPTPAKWLCPLEHAAENTTSAERSSFAASRQLKRCAAPCRFPNSTAFADGSARPSPTSHATSYDFGCTNPWQSTFVKPPSPSSSETQLRKPLREEGLK